MPSTTSLSPSGLGSRFLPLGRVALKPAAISGVTIIKMISSTSMMSIIGTTFGSDLTDVCPAPPTLPAIAYLLIGVTVGRARSAMDVASTGNGLLGLELFGEDRAAELTANALD